MGVFIHRSCGIAWQDVFANKMQAGLKAIGIASEITDIRHRVSDVAILCGTTLWRSIEAEGDYLLVDRASFGDPQFIQLVWNGHGRHGDHCVPVGAPANRWEKIQVSIDPWRRGGDRVVLCGQTEPYTGQYTKIEDWYESVKATHFRSHPAGHNPTGLPKCGGWDDCRQMITLNSSVAVEAVFRGIPTVTMDDLAMAWDVTSHDQEQIKTPDRTKWLHWLAWTQWHHDEVLAGHPIKHLFEEL